MKTKSAFFFLLLLFPLVSFSQDDIAGKLSKQLSKNHQSSGEGRLLMLTIWDKLEISNIKTTELVTTSNLSSKDEIKNLNKTLEDMNRKNKALESKISTLENKISRLESLYSDLKRKIK